VWAVLLLAAGAVAVSVRRRPNRRKLDDELVAREKAQGEQGWWWLSFADPGRPDGQRFLGVAIVEGYGVGSASRRAHELGVNPGGEVRGEQLSGDAIPPSEYRNRLLSRSDLEDAGLIDKQTISEKDDPELVEAMRSALPCFDLETQPLDEDDMVLTCRRVWENGEPVRYVGHNDDGSFEFTCGGDEHTSAEQAVKIHARHLFDRGPDQLRDFTYLRKGCFAQQNVDGKWNLGNLPPEPE